MEMSTLEPRMFHIVRNGDESGVSGTGRVLDGILWANGWVNVMWRTDLDPLKKGMSSITFFDSFRAFEDIHITSHPDNKTEIVWDDVVLSEVQEDLEKTKTLLNQTRKKFRDFKAEVAEHDEEEKDGDKC